MNNQEKSQLDYFSLLRSAELFAKDNNFAAAVSCAIKAANIIPDNKDAANSAFRYASELTPNMSIPIIKNNLKILLKAEDSVVWFGIQLINKTMYTEAIDFLTECLKYMPKNPAVYNNLAVAYKRVDMLEDAKKTLLAGISIVHNYRHFYTNLASIARIQKENRLFIAYLQEAIKVSPDDPGTFVSLIEGLKSIGEFNGALSAAIDGANKFPKNYDLHLVLGNIYASLKKYDKAMGAYENAIAIDTSRAQAHNNLGVLYKELNENEKALDSYQKALSIDPGAASTHNNIGNLLRKMDRVDEAIVHLQKSIEINPKYPDTYSNMGAIYKEQKEYDMALEFYQKALEIDPEHMNANFDISLIYLSEGRYEDGFQKYEYRLKMPELIAKTYKYKTPIWNGQSLAGKSIMLQNEQGYGDNIMFIRYAKNIHELGAKVLVRTRAELCELFKSSPYIDGVFSEEENIASHDFYLPLLSCARIFETTLDTIPRELPYLFAKEETDIQKNDNTLSVGLVWSSSKTNKDFKNKYLGLDALIPLFDLRNTIFYSLQVGEDSSDIKRVGLENKIVDLSGKLTDFSKTAAAIAAMDVVVSMDTAIAHLCGAMDKKAFVLLPKYADWRWMQDGDVTPWYKSLRLFRQNKKGDWSEPVLAVKTTLQEMVR